MRLIVDECTSPAEKGVRPVFQVWLGVLTMWPIAYLSAGLAFAAIAAKNPGHVSKTLYALPIIVVLHLLTIIGVIGLLVFYIKHVLNCPSVSRDNRTPLILLLLVGNMLAMPFFWYYHVWREE